MRRTAFLICLLIWSFGCSQKQNELEGFVESFKVDPGFSDKSAVEVERISDKLFRVNVTADLPKDTVCASMSVNILPAFKASFHWAPHLTPTDQHIISDHVFRAPALVMTNENKVLTLIPDLDARRDSPYRWYMDLNAPKNQLTIGLGDYKVKEHVLFQKKGNTAFKKGKASFAFFVMVDEGKEAVQNPWRRPLAFMWEKYGKQLAQEGKPVDKPLEAYVKHTYNWAFNTWEKAVWQEFELNGKKVGAPVFIVNYTQSPNYPGEVSEREFRSIFNQAWFSSLRSAQGLYRYGRRTGNQDYIRRANMTKELALSFPQTDGLFPAIVGTDMGQVEVKGKKYWRSKGWNTLYFGNSNRNPVTRDPKTSPLHILDMSFTAYQMLTWYEELEKDERLLEYAKTYANRLVKLQGSEGFYAVWLDFKTQKDLGLLRRSPETAMSAAFLFKLYGLTKDEQYKTSALKATKAMSEFVVPYGKWEDFETYWSCSRWGQNDLVDKKVERNNMYKQNTLSMYYVAEAMFEAYQLTKEKQYLGLGQRTVDELLMNQAVWQPPYMYVGVFGGFGVMNADGEWNDSRQALFADLFIRYGKLLDNREYIERGVVALKSSFSMMYCEENAQAKKQWEAVYPYFDEKDYGFMMENYGHGGYAGDKGSGIGKFTIYDWGNGAASETYMKIIDRYGEEILNLGNDKKEKVNV
ncbi:hypothetical protein FUAX_20630 [Fulvitalea axinellae]|uniref:Uncharacterized protein n=1 Tax=Fulvitalea axinellae TaxID=1182444 RepID=A0AAU9CKY2_9BACT|nr:hypothetical protein FUAX_20630 [Fulvitalea axinellae]